MSWARYSGRRRLPVGALVASAAAAAWVLVASAPAAPQTSGPVTTSFTTAGTFTFRVPAGICQVSAVTVGASGGSSTSFGAEAARSQFESRRAGSQSGAASGSAPFVHAAASGTGAGGAGGSAAAATLPVTPGETLVVTVGSVGADYGGTGAGGTPDGGAGGTNGIANGAGGGGSSDIRRGGNDLAHRVLIGGGGGGAGFAFFDGDLQNFFDGGAGGGASGGKGDPQDPTDTGSGGGGTPIAGGAAGLGAPFGPDGSPGAVGQGGAGASNAFGASGGGGGLFGGGGGAADTLDEIAAAGFAGGGGSGFGPPGTVFQTGVNTGTGSVRITVDPANSGCAPVAVVAVPRFTG